MPSLPADLAPAVGVAGWRLVAPRASEWQSRFRPVTAMRLMIAFLVVAQLGRIPLLSTGDRDAPLLLNDLAVMAVLGAGLLSGVIARSFRVDRVAGLGFVFAAVGAFSAVLGVPRYGLSGFELLISLAYLVRWFVYFLLYVVVINVVRATDVNGVWRAIERTVVAFAIFGLFQSVFLPEFAQMVYPGDDQLHEWDRQGHRLVSTVLDPNIAGAMILLVLLVHVAQIARGTRQSFWQPAILFAALLATLSRSSLIGLFVGVAIITAVNGLSRRLVRVGAVLTLLFLVSLPQLILFAQSYNKLKVDGSALTRLAQWARALRIFSDHPILGIGFNTYGFVQERYGYTRLGTGSYALDGGLLFIAVMTGLVGVVLYVGMISAVVSRCRRVWRDATASPEWRAYALGIAAGTIGVIVQSLFVNSLLTTFVMELLWILWGLAFVMAVASRSHGSASRLPVSVAGR